MTLFFPIMSFPDPQNGYDLLFPLDTPDTQKRSFEYTSAFETKSLEELAVKKTRTSTSLINPLLPVALDSPEQIDEWIKERKKKYPKTKSTQNPNSNENVDALDMLAGYGSDSSSEIETPKNSKPQNSKGLNKNLDINLENSDQSETSSSEDSDIESDSETSEPEVLDSKIPLDTPFQPHKIGHDESRSKNKTCTYFIRSKCTKGDKCPFLHPQSVIKTDQPETTAGNINHKLGLLEHILAKDINVENTRLLQCLYYLKTKTDLLS
ncbi:hypothetical protein BB559_001722 [Furculomyces boomerangus]|uniref:C3H1-type domain-containing protein n=2 Tax=Harpellales TaxID=61421 RepID=A0A2T9Z139_9FUNG|nr:hypothetical protein BB559_001722 [Furculomyces boomerangus]PVZ96516.1 hypothetical protein BB558_007570 [Smittium angustum]